jgi:hypothetical protein
LPRWIALAVARKVDWKIGLMKLIFRSMLAKDSPSFYRGMGRADGSVGKFAHQPTVYGSLLVSISLGASVDRHGCKSLIDLHDADVQ